MLYNLFSYWKLIDASASESRAYIYIYISTCKCACALNGEFVSLGYQSSFQYSNYPHPQSNSTSENITLYIAIV